MLAAPGDLDRIGVHKSDGQTHGTKSVTDGTANTAGADDGDCFHATNLRLAVSRSRDSIVDASRGRETTHCYFFMYSFKYPSNCCRCPSSSPRIVIARSCVT